MNGALETPPPIQRRRRVRYPGKHPRRFEHKYKELDPVNHPETLAKVMASGKTPAGSHRPIMVAEILQTLDPRPGQVAVDCTLGFGGHAQALLARLIPGGRLLGLDADPIELPKTESRLRALGFAPETFLVRRTNFAGLTRALWESGLQTADLMLADLGVSSMQLDNPVRGFSLKNDGPLDMRMNPQRGQSASAFLENMEPHALRQLLEENADEPRAALLAPALAGRRFATTLALVQAVKAALPTASREDAEDSVRRVFQALRIAVNEEFSALETLLRQLPAALNPDGCAAILTFHSGEDRRVKKFFEAGLRDGSYARIGGPIRPELEERRANPRSTSAKLRWARKSSAETPDMPPPPPAANPA